MRKIKGLLILAVLMTIITGCATSVKPTKIQSGKYEERVSKSTEIYFPVSINNLDLNSIIGENLTKGQLLHHEPWKRESNTTHTKFSVYLDKLPTISSSYGALSLNIPIRIEAEGNYKSCAGWWSNGRCRGASHTKTGTATSKINVNLIITPTIKEDYTINFSTKANFKVSKTHLKLKFVYDLIRVNINITKQVSKALKKKLPNLLKDIDAEIAKNLPPMSLKNLIAKDWNKLVKPVKAGDLWVEFKPSEVLFRGFHTSAKGSDLRLGLGAKGLINVSLSEPQSKNIPIPPIKQISKTDSILNAYIPLHSAFDDMEKIANKEFAGKRFENNNYFLKINELGFNGVMVNNKSKLLIDIDFEGGRDTHWYDFFTDRVNGHLYFLATPEYDSAKRVMYISDLELTSETSSSLIDLGLNWMFKLKKDILLNELKVDVGQHIDKLDKEATAILSQGLSFDNFKIKGSLEELTFDGFYMDNNEMELYIQLTAALETQYVKKAPQSK